MINRRRVQLTGTSTFTVSLPKEWAKRYAVRRGTELAVTETSDGSLIFGLREPGRLEKASVNVGEFDDPDELRRRFLALYLAGFGEVRFFSERGFPLEMKKVIAEEAKRLVGMEATEETAKSIVVHDFFSHEGLPMDKALRRIHLITCGLYEEVLKAFAETDRKRAESVIGRDDDVDRLRFLLLRQLNLALRNTTLLRELGLTTSDCLNYATAVRNIENLADNVMKMAKYTAQISGASRSREAASKLGALNRDAYDLYRAAMEAFLRGDEKKANKVIGGKKRIKAAVNELEKELLKQVSPTIFQYGVVLDKIRNVCELSSEIAELAINWRVASANPSD